MAQQTTWVLKAEDVGLDEVNKKSKELVDTLTTGMKGAGQNIGDISTNYNQMNGRLTASIRNTKRFRMELLSVMFFGMALTKMFGQYTSNMKEMFGWTDVFSYMIEDSLIPVFEDLQPLLDGMLVWWENLSDEDKKAIGIVITVTDMAGNVLQGAGQLGLGALGLSKLFGADGMLPLTATLSMIGGKINAGVSGFFGLLSPGFSGWGDFAKFSVLTMAVGIIFEALGLNKFFHEFGMGIGETIGRAILGEEAYQEIKNKQLYTSIGLNPQEGAGTINPRTISQYLATLDDILGVSAENFAYAQVTNIDEIAKEISLSIVDLEGNVREYTLGFDKASELFGTGYQNYKDIIVEHTGTGSRQILESGEEFTYNFHDNVATIVASFDTAGITTAEGSATLVGAITNVNIDVTTALSEFGDGISDEGKEVMKKLEDVFDQAVDAEKNLQAITGDRSLWDEAAGFLGGIAQWGWEGIQGNPMLNPLATHFAAGGIVTRPTMGLVGEAGPEAIIPLSEGSKMFGDITINVNANLNNSADARSLVEEVMSRLQRQLSSGVMI